MFLKFSGGKLLGCPLRLLAYRWLLSKNAFAYQSNYYHAQHVVVKDGSIVIFLFSTIPLMRWFYTALFKNHCKAPDFSRVDCSWFTLHVTRFMFNTLFNFLHDDIKGFKCHCHVRQVFSNGEAASRLHVCGNQVCCKNRCSVKKDFAPSTVFPAFAVKEAKKSIFSKAVILDLMQ